MFTTVYSWLPMFTLVYLCLPLFTRVYLCLLVFPYVYHCLLVQVHLCLPLFTHVYLRLHLFTYVYHCFARIYLCLPQFTHTCLHIFTLVYDLIPLESESRVWSRIINSLPAGQLSFLLRAGIDCLPTPVTLSRWRYQCDSSCKLCHYSSCTVHHILNCCPASLNQGRYTWRHDSVLKYTAISLST